MLITIRQHLPLVQKQIAICSLYCNLQYTKKAVALCTVRLCSLKGLV